jgi:hypothetical protein
LKQTEESYENAIKSIAEKDRILDDLQADNNTLRIQLEQMQIIEQHRKDNEILAKAVIKEARLKVADTKRQ